MIHRTTTILVLTPSTGGYYYGGVLAGITREAAAAGARLVLVQTLDPGARNDDVGELNEFSIPVAWSQVDGVVSITTAVRGAYLQRVRDAGIPVVLASTRLADFHAPAALPDNRGGTAAGVEHLISHGHTRIGFVGFLGNSDIVDRHDSFDRTLAAYHLEPGRLFEAPDNAEGGGEQAARDVIAAAERPTALMVACDRNAIGLMRELTFAGLRVPEDIAVVSFDNIDAAAFSSPTLSSVNQRFDEVGALATRLLLAQMRGEAVPVGAHTSQAGVVAMRGSCGCTAESGAHPAEPNGAAADNTHPDSADDRSPDASGDRRRAELLEVLGGAVLTGNPSLDAPRRAATLAMVLQAEHLRQLGDSATTVEIRSLEASLRSLSRRPDVLRRITGAVTEHLQHASRGAGAGTDRLTTALWQLQAGAFLWQAECSESALEEQYAVDAGLHDAGHSDPRALGWLAGTHVRAGVLAMWVGDPSAGRLRIAGTYDPAGLLPDLVGLATTAQQFPPEPLIDAGQPAERRVAIVVPVRTKERDWGLLAVVGDIDTYSARETYHHWATLLCAAFEEEGLQDSVRASEERYALVARATNDGLWEWDARTGSMYLSDRCAALLGLAPGPAGGLLARWTDVVHPDDLAQMQRGMHSVATGRQEATDTEYRVRTADGDYRWVQSRALGVKSAHGPVERVVGALADIHERRCLEDRLREFAMYDVLTGLPNRRLFLDRLTHALTRAHRSNTPFAVLFLDLDGFKVINDSLGHQMGDRVLRTIGARIERSLRDVDTGARFGGDEFAVLLHDVAPGDVLVIAQRVQAALVEVIDLDGHQVSVRASLGVATSAIDYTCAEDVLRDADTAMYHAKAVERGSVAFFDAEMHAKAVRQLLLHTELRHALDAEEFEVHYQPIVDLGTGRTDRFEALVRWRHPERGLVPPDEFLPLMAEVGLIVRLGHLIVDEVCRQLAAWGPAVANVAVNVSDREFWHKDLLSHVLRSLTRHGITADRLTLEITEGVIMRQPELALTLMGNLHDAGLHLHIDDFGTGYSSLEMLHRFPVDAFKIDRSFIRALEPGERTANLVSAIVAMGNALGLAVVAEGIETAEQLAFLKGIGCVTGQGFLFMPAVVGTHAPRLLGRDLGSESTRSGEPQPVP
ncbi:EAL domain-containing protein [Pengzhenrongella frigida]|nr:EAL domain-containing protein [Cellulomonas sp. HLT2-17]